ncbi:hypothetical protein AA313_de0204616 [Arthrobotrys entomopaga]|nr:hypothetical protein AA313_de0204616 [Arthrobotrys entomopaga]
MAATQAHQIQVHTASMIKTVEDLLTLTRALKEAWLFGQMGEDTAPNGEKNNAASSDGVGKEEAEMDEDAKFVIEWLKSKIQEGNMGDDENVIA